MRRLIRCSVRSRTTAGRRPLCRRWQAVRRSTKETAAQKSGWDRQRSNCLRALLTSLRWERRSITALRDDISAPRPPDVEMEQVRAGLLEQLDRFARQQLSSDGLDFSTWVHRTIAEHDQWLARIVFPKL